MSNRTLTLFVPLPHTENGYTCKTEHRPLPYRTLQVRNKKSGIYTGAGEWYNKLKCTNTHHVRNVAESLLVIRLLFARKSVQNLISKLSIESVTEPSLTPTIQSIAANDQTLLQSRKGDIENARRLPLVCQSFHAIVVPAQRICTCTT